MWNVELPWHVAAERWLWSCWWVMNIGTSGRGRWEICDCCWAGCAEQLRSRCELCPSAPSSENPVPKQDYTHKKILESRHPSFHPATWEIYLSIKAMGSHAIKWLWNSYNVSLCRTWSWTHQGNKKKKKEYLKDHLLVINNNNG